MLQFKNRTPFQGTVLLIPDPDGIDSLYTLVKATFVFGPEVVLAPKQLPIALQDQFRGEPGQSSLKVASDLGLIKPGADVLLQGTAYAPGGQPAKQMDVHVVVGPVRKTVRVFGQRVWESGFLAPKISKPEPFETMPLVWERAFGGADMTDGELSEVHAENRNPVGAGFWIKNGKNKLEGMKLPNLEDPKHLISSWKDRVPPAAFGPICPHWEPRRMYAGTYDGEWQKHRAPYLPKNFDSRFFQLSSPDLVAPGYLKGGEEVEVRGATPSGLLRFRLPRHEVQATYRLDDEDHIRPANLDTVVIEPDESRLVLVWRTVFPCDKKAIRVREIEAALVSSTQGT